MKKSKEKNEKIDISSEVAYCLARVEKEIEFVSQSAGIPKSVLTCELVEILRNGASWSNSRLEMPLSEMQHNSTKVGRKKSVEMDGGTRKQLQEKLKNFMQFYVTNRG